MKGLKKAIRIFGSKAALAKKLGVEPMAIRQWEIRRVPAERAKDIEKLTSGEVTRHELRPDLFDKVA